MEIQDGFEFAPVTRHVRHDLTGNMGATELGKTGLGTYPNIPPPRSPVFYAILVSFAPFLALLCVLCVNASVAGRQTGGRGAFYCGAIRACRSKPCSSATNFPQKICSSPRESVNLAPIAGSGAAMKSNPAIRQELKGLEARPGRRKHPAFQLALSRRNAGILSEVSAIDAADCRPVCTGRVAASPFPLRLLEGAPPGHDGPNGVFSQVCRADFQADYFC